MSTRKRVADSLIQGLKEAALHSQDKLKLRQSTFEIPGPAPRWSATKIKRLRKEIYHVSQPVFAAILNVTTSTVRSWEQGQKSPSGTASRLLQILELDHRLPERLVN